MKKTFLSALILTVIINVLAIPAMASDRSSDYTIYYDDGSYAVVAIRSGLSRASISDAKFYTFYNAQGQRCFSYAIHASFTYDGTTSRADSCYYSADVYRQGWDMSSHSEYVSGSTAYGRAAFTGPDGQTRSVSLTLTCDKNGAVT